MPAALSPSLLFRPAAVNDARLSSLGISVFRPMSLLKAVFQPDSFIVADVAPSPNFDARKDNRAPDMILLHYTGMQTGEAALQQLTAPQSEYNLLEVDFLWAGEFPKAGWLLDLSPLIAESKSRCR